MTKQENSDAPDDEGEWVIKILARSGVGSRRDVERMIKDGRVRFKGKILESPVLRVINTSELTVDGAPVAAPEPARLWRYYKPRGLVTTHKDPQGRPTVFSKLPSELGRVVSVGRLDLNSEGLLLLTNDGELARWMEAPSTGWKRRYRVRAFGKIDRERLSALSKGIEIEGIRYRGIKAQAESTKGMNSWLRIELIEGKNREIRRVLKHLGLEVSRLIRTSFGPFELGNQRKGEIREAPLSTVVNLPEDLKKRLGGRVKVHAKTGWAKPRQRRRSRK
jgi:23S rRNA pseudouridine2605 synthase